MTVIAMIVILTEIVGIVETRVNEIAFETVTEIRIVAIVKEPEITKTLIERGFDPAGLPGAEFAKVIKSDYEKYGKLIRERGIKIE